MRGIEGFRRRADQGRLMELILAKLMLMGFALGAAGLVVLLWSWRLLGEQGSRIILGLGRTILEWKPGGFELDIRLVPIPLVRVTVAMESTSHIVKLQAAVFASLSLVALLFLFAAFKATEFHDGGAPAPVSGSTVNSRPLKIVAVTEASPADEAGLQAGMAIVRVSGNEVRAVADLHSALLDHQDQIELEVDSEDDGPVTVTMPLSRVRGRIAPLGFSLSDGEMGPSNPGFVYLIKDLLASGSRNWWNPLESRLFRMKVRSGMMPGMVELLIFGASAFFQLAVVFPAFALFVNQRVCWLLVALTFMRFDLPYFYVHGALFALVVIAARNSEESRRWTCTILFILIHFHPFVLGMVRQLYWYLSPATEWSF